METSVNSIIFSTLILFIGSGNALLDWSSLSPALERMTTYGYHMLGYPPPKYHKNKGEIDVPIVWGPIWNGHIPVGDFVSPLLSVLGSSNSDSYDDRVVKGYENRLGFRVAVPYLGDLQVTREVGPGRFTDKLGPGSFPYPGIEDTRPDYDPHHNHHDDHHHTSDENHHPHDPHHDPPQGDMYQGLKNYPWYRRK
ncbi:hypothetical protein Pcinc_031728 [Petrolisthes cinctipes]|uniref:Uncharacterized protein n=1 Tax=Petrolisthes cinctipes TaxID=88211 RepID=A0AAE1EW36_PETCI|nr:hypothetical protein Pcinc_031728 [Petrolisthes cinctipes]